MSNNNWVTKHITRLVLLMMIGVGMDANAGLFGIGGASWKEEALQPDGQKIMVERNVVRKGNHEIGQRPPIGNQSLTFSIPNTGERVTWEDSYSEDVGGGNFNPMLLGVQKNTAYVLASPAGCLSYNKWGRPNPPYVIFKYEAKQWQRIQLQELPAEFKSPNLVISSPDDAAEEATHGILMADKISELNTGFQQPVYMSILREPLAASGQGSCPELVYYKGAWIGPGDSIGKRMMDRIKK
ncbi:hypothetical protein [Sideroxydans lithotrophicus]|uniref:Uncharacterized protein n=1 Tax=Sideroxydans lithotrophicus (strain ES-1) TaxID=580332 RepID=D5CLT5_SIDLE|nr:hypothetical protein [Sideroxydans lithotrophicus]ADE12530.1 conserved hypothetical protein [Sideroxydans lithotrophicus ES-1]